MDKKAKDEEMGENENEEEMNDEEEEEEEEEGEMEKTKKSVELTGEDLQKSLEKLEEYAQAGDDTNRKEALLNKALTDDLEEDEREELLGLLGGGQTFADDTLADSVAKGFDDNDSLQKALDVSDYLQANQDELQKSLGLLSDHIEKSERSQNEFNLVLAKSVVSIGQHVASMAERLGTIEMQPVRKPKALGAVPLQKSFAGHTSGDQLSKSEIMNGLTLLTEEAIAKGEDALKYAIEVSKLEQTNSISPQVLAQVQNKLGKRSA